MPLQATSGAASYDAFGGGVPVVTNYIEDVFSTYLYTGTNSTQSIVNGIDLSTKGGMCWFKIRDTGTYNHALVDTARGRAYTVGSDITDSEYTSNSGNDLASFNTNGFTVGPVQQFSAYNRSGNTIVNWTFRKQPKFFDVVTWFGDGASNRRISHSLGSTPGCIIVKRLDSTSDWFVWHRSVNTTTEPYLYLNQSGAPQFGDTNFWGTSNPTSTDFGVGAYSGVNADGSGYVAYVFAHNAGGFGLTGTDNVISCGSFTLDGSGNATVSLGYEPQWVMIKKTSAAENWYVNDIMRGLPIPANNVYLSPNTSGAEASGAAIAPTSTGLAITGLSTSGSTYVYIAIRRGPMKVPTSGTSVFSPVYVPTVVTGTKSTTGFPVDLQILSYTTGTTENQTFVDRLRGISTTATESGRLLISSSTAAEATTPAETRFWDNTGFQQQSYFSGGSAVYWNFRRAPSFFDEVCYTGDGSARTVTHNLGVVPELMIVKERGGTSQWYVYASPLGNTKALWLNITGQERIGDGYWNDTTPTSSVFSLGGVGAVNTSGDTYVNYLFSTCAGVSKVFTYTGNGSSQTINCGFTGGARFVLIKRTDDSGDWYVWDTARGMVAGNDPHLSLNSTAAEVTTDDSVDTDSTGFIVNQLSATNVNVTSATYIGIAIA